jgi:hypothetical protein
MKRHIPPATVLTAGLAAASIVPLAAAGQTPARAGEGIPSPETFFGHRMGADRRLARWDRLVSYYDTLDALSDRILVEEAGPTTLGNPFLIVFVSSPQNLAQLDQIRRRNAVLQDPRGRTPAEVEDAIANGRVVFVQSYGLHSTEVAGSQTAAEVVYDFATRTDETMQEILANTLSIIIPNFNPDGNFIVTDWYDRWVGTEYEGSSPPELYHHYAGHDNNRDAFMQNTVESQYGARILFRDWVPQAYIDHHQMGPYTARIYLPPYAEPIRPEADPLVWREMTWYGAHMAYKMDEAELVGAIGSAIYPGWGHFGFHWITPFHNIAGMLTESASARLASPLFVHPDQLRGARQFPEYVAQTTFPSPWPGGWWRVRDIVDRQVVATFAPLELAAKNRETVLRNAYHKAIRQIRRGLEGEARAYVIPADQHDPLTMQKMVNRLLGQGITVERAVLDFRHEGRLHGAGSYVVSLAQPKRGVIRWLLGRTFYPDNAYTRSPDGNPIRPYDMATDNLAEFMGVEVVPVESPVAAALAPVHEAIDPSGTVSRGQHGYVLDGRLNDSFAAVNRLLRAGALVRRASRNAEGVRPGDFLVGLGVDVALISEIVEETGVDLAPLEVDLGAASYPLGPQRIGIYRRYYGGNMDEGWTRFLLEEFGFEYTSVRDQDIVAGGLEQRFDVIILPADSKEMMTGERAGARRAGADAVPPEYRSGFGEAGVRALVAFVENGGTLVTLAQAGDLVLDEFGVPVRNVVAGLSGTEFWAPGSTLRVRVDTQSDLGYGMPEDALATFLPGGQVYETVPDARSASVARVVTYPDRDILQSGWLIGEGAIANRAAVVSVEKGRGRIVMIGFRPQHRAQTHGTFKLLFNALVDRPESTSSVAASDAGNRR